MLSNEKIETFKSLYIEMFFNDNKISSGTCFIIERNGTYFLVTNKHNATGRDVAGECLSDTRAIPNYMKVYFRKNSNIHITTPKLIPLYSNDEIDDQQSLWVEHPNQSEYIDVVCIPLETYEDVEYLVVDIFEGVDYEKSETDLVSVIGFPFGLQGEYGSAIWSTGFIASNPIYRYDNQDKFLIDCRSRQGQSGSPVYAYNQAAIPQRIGGHNLFFNEPTAKFMGIYSGRINNMSDLGYVWKPTIIEEIIVASISQQNQTVG